jgi:AmiR/NasT family two-component response regulator
MYVLILHGAAAPLSQLAELLRRGNHDVSVVTDAAAAKAVLAKRRADIAVASASVDDLAAVAMALRPPEDATYRSLIAVVGKDTSAARQAAFGAGADDVVVASASASELADHVHSAERVVKLERRLRERVAELESALRRLSMQALARGQEVATGAAKSPGGGGGLTVLLTTTWTGLEELLGNMCTEYLQTPFVHLVGAAPPSSGCRGSRISLSDTENQLKLELSFYASDESARAIATSFCGGDASVVDDDVIRDVLLELANSGMGVIKAGFLGEQFRFVGAIPEPTTSADRAKAFDGAEAKRVLAFRSDKAVVYVAVTLKHQGRVRVLGARLKEGMVVASDVKSEAGVLLVRAGTRLTETTAEKLARLFPKGEIELADAAA